MIEGPGRTKFITGGGFLLRSARQRSTGYILGSGYPKQGHHKLRGWLWRHGPTDHGQQHPTNDARSLRRIWDTLRNETSSAHPHPGDLTAAACHRQVLPLSAAATAVAVSAGSRPLPTPQPLRPGVRRDHITQAQNLFDKA